MKAALILAVLVSMGVAKTKKDAPIKVVLDTGEITTGSGTFYKLDATTFKPDWCDTAITSSFIFHDVADSVRIGEKMYPAAGQEVQVYYKRTKPNCY